MPDSQRSFVMFGEWWGALSVLSDEQRGRLLQAVYAIHGFCEAPDLDQATQGILALIEPRMRSNWERYQKTLEKRREAGRHGGLAKASNAKQTLANASNAKQSLANSSKGLANPSKLYQNLDGTGSGSDTGTDCVVPSGLEYTPPYPPQGGSACAEEPPAEIEAKREEPVPERKPRKRKAPDLRPGDFEAFWEKYPRKDAKERARKAWDHLARAGELADQFTLMAALTWRCSYWKEQQTPNNYIPQCSTWIGEKRWNEPKPPAPPPRQPTWPRRQSLLSPEERAIEESRVSLENAVRRLQEQGGDGG